MTIQANSQTLGAALPFPLDEYHDRWQRLEEEIKRLGYDTAVIWGRSGGSYDRAGAITYLCNYASHASGQEWSTGATHVGSGFAAMIFRPGNEPELHVAEPATTVELRYVATDRIFEHLSNLATGVASRLRTQRVEGRVAYLGYDMLPLQMYNALQAAHPGVEWVAEDHLLDELMSHKSPAELDTVREACTIACEALGPFIEALRRGERQCDAAAAAAAIIISHGGGFQRVGCHTGPRSELAFWDNPLYSYSTERAQPGDMVRAFVYGPILNGYWVDPGRSAVCGAPSPEQKRLLENGVDMTEYVIGQIRAGRTPRDVGRAGNEHLAALGYAEDLGAAIWELYGHGLSTFWHPPLIPAHGAVDAPNGRGYEDADRPFHVGQVFTVETFLREEGVGTTSFEEVFIVEENGVERLTDSVPMLYW